MTALLVGLLVCVGVAVAVIVLVALPHLREGAPLLAPEGERLATQARRRASRAAGTASSRAAVFREKITAAVMGRDPDVEQGRNPLPRNDSGAITGTTRPAPAGPPRQVPSAAATPAPGTPRVADGDADASAAAERDRHRVDQPR